MFLLWKCHYTVWDLSKVHRFDHGWYALFLYLLTSSIINVVPTCTDLGRSVNNGTVHYSGDPTEQGRYVENTTVTVSCDEGYRGGGHITCQNDGNWSSLSLRLPKCTGKLALSTIIIVVYNQCNLLVGTQYYYSTAERANYKAWTGLFAVSIHHHPFLPPCLHPVVECGIPPLLPHGDTLRWPFNTTYN